MENAASNATDVPELDPLSKLRIYEQETINYRKSILDERYLTRRWYLQMETQMQSDFDKTILSLSGGGLGVSFVFLKDVLAGKAPLMKEFLLLAWICWGISSACVLFSYATGAKAWRRSADQINEGAESNAETRWGGRWDQISGAMNKSAGLAFIVGLALMILFVAANIG